VARLLAAGVPGVLRLGDVHRVHPDCLPATRPLREARVVALTATHCAGPSGLPADLGRFDVALLDEAAQMPLPLALAPLARADAFVLAGDAAQLAPLWTSREARAAGGEESLFARLASAHPAAVTTLRMQYRMAAEIQALPNALVYAGALVCGSASVAERRLQLSPLPADAPAWLRAAADGARRLLLLDTDALGAAAAAAARPLANAGEAALCGRLAAALHSAGLPPGHLSLLTPYNAQVEALRAACAAAGCPAACVAAASTVDKAQGRDVPAVILSLAATLPLPEAGLLLADARRLCVALTRAQSKLVLVGSVAMLRAASPLMLALVQQAERDNWLISLPADALP